MISPRSTAWWRSRWVEAGHAALTGPTPTSTLGSTTTAGGSTSSRWKTSLSIGAADTSTSQHPEGGGLGSMGALGSQSTAATSIRSSVVLTAVIEIRGQQLPPLLLSATQRPVRVGLEHRDCLCLGVAEVTVTIFAIERLIAFTSENLIQLRQSMRTIRPFIESVTWTHQLINEPAENVRWTRRAFVRLREHQLQDVCHPSVSS